MTERKIESARKLRVNGVPSDMANLGVSMPTLYRWIRAFTQQVGSDPGLMRMMLGLDSASQVKRQKFPEPLVAHRTTTDPLDNV